MANSKAGLLWLVPVIALVAMVGVVYWFALRPQIEGDNSTTNQPAAAKVPELGGRGRPMENAPVEPGPDNSGPVDGAATDGGEPQPEPDAANSAREIDIWLSNLAIATKAGDRKGIALNHEMLKAARPDTLVDERVRNALDNEQSAWVRMQFFIAYHDPGAKFDWAMHVYDTRTAKFMGTDDQYAGGEVEELKLVARELFAQLITQWRTSKTGDSRLMSLLRSALDTQKPDWLLDESVEVIATMIGAELPDFALAVQQELRGLLQRRTAERGIRDVAFLAYILTLEPRTAVFDDLARSEWWDYAATLAGNYRNRLEDHALGVESMQNEWIQKLLDAPELPALFDALLQGAMPTEDKRLLIQRVAGFHVPNDRALIEAGIARRDANYPDYLAALGAISESRADLQRLTAAADDPDPAAAQGAIEGLRQSGGADADAELRKVLENGSNVGVKANALGALLLRTDKKDALLEEYLDEGKDASLRAVAAQAVPLTSLERVQRIAEEDSSPTVRLVAVNRVGSVVPKDIPQRKELHAWFVKIKERDNSQVIRAAARKYAEDLNP